MTKNLIRSECDNVMRRLAFGVCARQVHLNVV
jgi:hypothetical protein